MWRGMFVGLIVLLLLAACGASTGSQQDAVVADALSITVYKPPT